MALRVLLADESPTIKKVFQLALQDFAAEVKTVNLGPDVATVAQQFKPDIIFCDVLLQKKSGYDVSAQLKGDQDLKATPVVLMWSGFMELDQDKFQAAKADGSLEKPFEVTDLRKLIHQFVPRTRSQKISDFLRFPKMPEIVEAKAPIPPVPATPAGGETWTMDSFAPIQTPGSEAPEEFQEVPLPPRPQKNEMDSLDATDGEATNWSTKDIKKFKLDIPPGTGDDLAVDLSDRSAVDLEADLDVESLKPPPPPAEVQATGAPLNEAELERLIFEQSREIIESIAWKVVPDLAAQIIERELQRLLKEKSSSASP